jgi:SAM-dependent methyltransferase
MALMVDPNDTGAGIEPAAGTAVADPASSAAAYDPESFWECRLRSHFDLTGAGFRGIGKPFIQALYRQREIVFDRIIRRFRLDPARSDVIELGPGTGFYVNLWKSRRVRSLLGLDITRVATERLAVAHPSFRFIQADISRSWPVADESADIVTAFDVLFHIVDDGQFADSIGEAGRVLRPGGYLLVSDLFPRRAFRGHHQVSRTLAEYRTILARNRLDIVGRVPVFVTMHPALDVPPPLRGLAGRWWTWLEARLIADPRRGRRAGRILGALDAGLTRALPGGPSTETLIARKR